MDVITDSNGIFDNLLERCSSGRMVGEVLGGCNPLKAKVFEHNRATRRKMMNITLGMNLDGNDENRAGSVKVSLFELPRPFEHATHPKSHSPTQELLLDLSLLGFTSVSLAWA